MSRAIALAILVLALSLGLGSGAAAQDPTASRSGPATFFTPGALGNCLLPQGPDRLIAALNTPDYRGAEMCGAYVRVSRPGRGSVVVQITDRCPECAAGHIDLSPRAFNRIAAPREGRVPVTWRLIRPARPSAPVRFRFKEGSSRWWTAIQVRRHRAPIRSLEVERGGRFEALPREDYNYFVAAGGLGPGPYTLRLTDVFGHRLVESGIPLRPARVVGGRGQFPRR